MNYTDEEIARAKLLCTRDLRRGQPKYMAIMAVVESSRARQKPAMVHERTWRDYLPRARRELKREATR